MTELKMEQVLILGIVIFVLYNFMNRCSCNGFSVGGMRTNPECKDIAKGYQPLCGLLGVDMKKCSDYYTKSDGKGYFCVPDPKGFFSMCKQDDKICSESTEIIFQDQYREWVTGNRTFIGGNVTNVVDVVKNSTQMVEQYVKMIILNGVGIGMKRKQVTPSHVMKFNFFV